MSEKRKRIWKHNGFQGSIAMAMRAMHDITRTDTVSPAGQQLADDIWCKLYDLGQELKNNRQP